jgi:tetratricopeptide (TPR) repeat protein
MALAFLDKGNLEDAEAVLREMLAAGSLDSGAEERRLAVFALVHILFRREQFDDAAQLLDRTIEVKLSVAQSLQARFWLAEAHRRAARQEKKNVSAADTATAREHYQSLKKRRLELALFCFQGIERELASRPMSTDEQAILRESRMGIGECLYHLGRYQDAVAVYQTLAADQRQSAEGLLALMHLTHCYWTLKMLPQARATVDEARTRLQDLSDRDLESSPMNREAWTKWLDGAAASSIAPPDEPRLP